MRAERSAHAKATKSHGPLHSVQRARSATAPARRRLPENYPEVQASMSVTCDRIRREQNDRMVEAGAPCPCGEG